MASPQKENGFTAIANEILERLVKTCLLGAEYQVVFFLLRKTYGYQKKDDIISLTQFQKGTGLSRPTVVKTLKNLIARCMVVKTSLPHSQISFRFNKDYDSWVVNTSKLVKGKWKSGKDVLTETSKHVLTHKRKKEITKESTAQSAEVSAVINLFKEVNPSYQRLFGMPPQRAAVERLLKTHGAEKLSSMIAYLPKSNATKYAPTITTPSQFEVKLGDLIAWAQKEKSIKSKRQVIV